MQDEMETLSQAMSRLRSQGYVEDYRAADGDVVCGHCGVAQDPGAMTVDEIVRFEGESDPGDESILYALDAGCGHRGLYAAAYGPDTSRADAAVLKALPDMRR